MIALSQETNYIVFWYPTIFHQEKQHKTIIPKPIDISDGSSFPLFMTIEEEKVVGSAAYHLHYYLCKENKQLADLKRTGRYFKFTLKYVKHSRNGFVVYSYNLQELIKSYWEFFFKGNDAEKNLAKNVIEKRIGHLPSKKEIEDFVVERLFLNCYHNAKAFYHEHEVLHESDGRLKAYYKTFHNAKDIHYLTKVPDINSRNHEVIDWYLFQYERQFIKYAYDVSERYRKGVEHLTKIKKLVEKSREALKTDDLNKIHDSIVNLSWEKYCDENINGSQQKPIIEKKNFDELRHFHLSRLKKIKNIDEKKNEIKELLSNFMLPYENKRYHEKFDIIQNICNNAVTEYTYCKTLLGSKYNKDYCYDSVFSEEEVSLLNQYYEKNISVRNKLIEKDCCRKRAFNIRNSIRYIEGIRKKCDSWRNLINADMFENIQELSVASREILKDSKKSGKRSEMLGFISVSIALIGIGIAEKDCKGSMYTWIIMGVLVILIGILKLYVIPQKK